MPETVEGARRRRVMVGAAALLGGLAASGAQAAPMEKKAATAANHARTSLHQEVAFNAAPAKIYDALLGSQAFASFSGAPAEIDPRAGGAFSLFGGQVVGRNVELVPNARIVQAWRAIGDWPPGVYSLVKIELTRKDSGTLLVLDHYGFQPGDYDHLYAGWAPHYWTPLKKLLG